MVRPVEVMGDGYQGKARPSLHHMQSLRDNSQVLFPTIVLPNFSHVEELCAGGERLGLQRIYIPKSYRADKSATLLLAGCNVEWSCHGYVELLLRI